MVYYLFERSRKCEVLFRLFVSKYNGIKQIALRVFNNDKHHNAKLAVKPNQWQKFKECIVNCGIRKGDFVLIHSSMQGLATLGVTSEDIFAFFEDLLGDEGTLAIPAYPDLKKMKMIDGVYQYDIRYTEPWTGRLSRDFLKREGVIRSQFPHNTLAAKGKMADAMMKDNAKGQLYSQGKGSSWEFGVNHGMKILYLGVKAPTSCTIVHYAEDQLADKWPVRDWYKEHRYIIVDECGNKSNYTTYERDEKWFNYYCMFNTGYRLRKKGYLKEYEIDGVYVGLMDSVKEMTDYLIEQAKDRKLLFEIPKSYMK